ncbi:MAG: Maf family protein [Clostridiales Family XIII bacterium]|jgi:septum formation protein|nr:Maf family protein [Clostridiales Family XIII bacterium]
MKLVLASASPRRREILEAHGYTPIVLPSEADETLPEGAAFSPEETAMYLAERKADAVAKLLLASPPPEAAGGDLLVLGVDTIVFRGRIIGKPKDEQDALAILRSLANGKHAVISGVCAIEIAGAPEVGGLAGRGIGNIIQKKSVFYDTTLVTFDGYTDADILAYVRANPPYDKSGSYAIQSDWGRHAVEVCGSVENVIGFPFEKIEPYLAGVRG